MADYTFKIITDKDKLHERAAEILVSGNEKEVRHIVKDLKKTLKDNNDLVAVSAPQIGYDARIFCIKFNDGKLQEFINPLISKTDGLHLSRETCKSLDDREYIIPRPDRILAIYETVDKKITSNKFEGPAAEVFQQMVNLLDGVLLSDVGLEVLPEFDKASAKQQQEVIEWYLNQLKATDEAFQADIDSDEELKQIKGAVEFLTKAANGEITIEKIEHAEKNKSNEA